MCQLFSLPVASFSLSLSLPTPLLPSEMTGSDPDRESALAPMRDITVAIIRQQTGEPDTRSTAEGGGVELYRCSRE